MQTGQMARSPKEGQPEEQDSNPKAPAICEACGLPIEDRVVRALEKTFHSACFVCSHCCSPIDASRFAEWEGKPYCGADCVKAMFEAAAALEAEGMATTDQAGDTHHICKHCGATIDGGHYAEWDGHQFCGADCVAGHWQTMAPREPSAPEEAQSETRQSNEVMQSVADAAVHHAAESRCAQCALPLGTGGYAEWKGQRYCGTECVQISLSAEGSTGSLQAVSDASAVSNAASAESAPSTGVLADAPPGGVFADCAPLKLAVRPSGESEAKFTLHYFAMRGRGEVIRLLLEEAGVSYDYVIWWVGKYWMDAKASMPFTMLPVLILPSGERIAQSNAIVRYLGKLFEMDGGSTPLNNTRVDVIYETALELKELKGELALGAERSTLQNLMEARSDNQKWTKLTALISALNSRLVDAGGMYFVGGSLSYADLAVYNSLNYIEGIAPGCLSALNAHALSRFHTFIASRPKLANYEKSERCYPMTELELQTPGYKSNGYPMGLKYVSILKPGQWNQEEVGDSTDVLLSSIRQEVKDCEDETSAMISFAKWRNPCIATGFAAMTLLVLINQFRTFRGK